MKNKKLLQSTRPQAIAKLAQLRRTREQIATSKLSAHERVVQEKLHELEKRRSYTHNVGQLVGGAQSDYEQCLHGGGASVQELQNLSRHVSKLSGQLKESSQQVAAAEQHWREACVEKARLAQNLKLASFKHSQAETMEFDSRALITRQRDIRRESEVEYVPRQGLPSAVLTSTKNRKRGE